jgi:hypothetical protein
MIEIETRAGLFIVPFFCVRKLQLPFASFDHHDNDNGYVVIFFYSALDIM